MLIGMQATVSEFDEVSRTGRVLLDDGVRLRFEAAALEGSRLRLLRPGQRVQIEVAGAGADRHVTWLQILTLR
jgi:hypothetical protein